ncbi:hypothetical protein GDO81_019260 [Engystomops pustulosus]|uniref:Axin beta-catenin binding domain-containing protein n=1 Tax=Engystomops pustulosus TaxID=76066 RepID=A0AAV6YUS2_ENGPU|nr:hypothetical protein GDO81_019260 [Engystomops pustulosus]
MPPLIPSSLRDAVTRVWCLQRTQRPPREMTPVEPARFAAELIVRLEKVRQEQETLQLITEEEEREECETPHDPQPLGSCEDDPQTILDEHLSRVLKTPGCQSPAAVGRSGVQTSRHVHHHHYIHQHQAAEPRRLVCPCCYVRTQRRGADPPLLHMDAAGGRCARREADAIVYLEERTSKHRSHSAQNIRRNPTRDSTRAASAERPGRHHQCSAPTGRSRQPPHPLLQDTAVVSVSTGGGAYDVT